eukprot:7587953-Heterocapsa_arctica.AAC.1
MTWSRNGFSPDHAGTKIPLSIAQYLLAESGSNSATSLRHAAQPSALFTMRTIASPRPWHNVTSKL